MPTVHREYLTEIAGILQKGLGSDETFDSVFDILEKTVSFDSATLFLYDSDTDKLETIHQKGDECVNLAEEFSFDRGKGMSSWVSKQSQPIILQSLKKSRAGKESRYCSLVSIPLRVGEKLIGVLNLGHKDPDVYRRNELGDYRTVASQISVVIEKMLLQRQVQEQNKQLKNALDELNKAQKYLIEKERLAAIGEIVVTVNHEINNPLSSIIGLAEILQFSYQTSKKERVEEGLKAILKSARQIQKVTERLATISSSESEEYVGSIKMTKLP